MMGKESMGNQNAFFSYNNLLLQDQEFGEELYRGLLIKIQMLVNFKSNFFEAIKTNTE